LLLGSKYDGAQIHDFVSLKAGLMENEKNKKRKDVFGTKLRC
jgi:hypothetical protein